MHLLTHYFQILPSFFIAISLATIFISSISGSAICFFWKQKLNSINFFFLPLFSLALFISVSYIFLYFLPSPLTTLKIIYGIFVIIGLASWFIKRKELIHLTKIFLRKKSIYMNLIILSSSLIIIILFYNFVYLNGLHDEYYHHAVIKLFIDNDKYPLLEPFAIGKTINSYYHIGLYFPVVVIVQLFNCTIENALDIVKIAILFPAIPLLIILIKKILVTKSKTLPVIITSSILLSGPSLFFQDDFSKAVFNNLDVPQIYLPILQDFAGITWLGLIFCLIFTFFFYLASENKIFSFPQKIIFLLLTLFALQLINQAFFIVYLVNIAVILIFEINKIFKSKRILLSTVFSLLLLIAIFSSNHYVKEIFSKHYENTSNVVAYFIRPPEQIGIPFDNKGNTNYVQIQDLGTIKKVGLLWFFSLILLIIYSAKYKNINTKLKLLCYLNLIVFPLASYFLSFDTPISLNKFLRPAFVWIPISVGLFGFNKNSTKIVTFTSIILLTFSLFPSFVYFLRANNQNLQRFWIVENIDEKTMINFLNDDKKLKNILTNTKNLQYLIPNNVNAQTTYCENDCKINNYQVLYVEDKSIVGLQKIQQELNLYNLIFSNQTFNIYKLQ